MIRTIKDIWYAVTSPESYRNFMKRKIGCLLLYVLMLIMFSGIVTIGIPSAKFMAKGGFKTLLDEMVPDFTASAEDGFWIEEPIEIDEYGYLIKANSDIVYEDITDLNGQYGSYESVIIVDKEKIYLKSMGAQEITARFDEMSEFSFSKENLLSYTPLLYAVAITVIVMILVVDYAGYFLTALMIAWFAGIMSIFLRIRFGMGKLYKMAIYAGTLSYILTTVQTVIGKSIPNFSFFSLIISMGYMYFAMKDYKESGIEQSTPEQFGNREG